MSYKKQNISYKETGMFSKTLTDYVDGASYLKPFYEYQPNISSFADAMKNVGKYEYSRQLLSDSLKSYYDKNAPGKASEATLRNIQKLKDDNCFTVITGHQLCLFTGPLYFIFKIITAINLAEKLNKEYPANHFVPVYWMASLDHDFAEINHANLYGKKVEWNGPKIGGPVGRMPLNTLTSTIEALFAIMGDSEGAKELKQIISDSYSSEKTLAEATFSFVNTLLGKYGLVIIEPDNADYAKIFAPIYKDELLNENTFKLVTATDKKLIETGVEPQVHPREINLFYIDENGRNRIEKKDDQFNIINSTKVFSQEQIIELLNVAPQNFCANVLLRPVFQQSLLPNVAYVGGPSEIAYWLQLKSIFEFYKVPFPVLISRNTALIINTPIPQKIAKLNLSIIDLFKDTESLIKELLKRIDGLPDFEKESAELREVYSALGNKVKEIDPTLVAFTEAELQKQLNALKTLETKLTRVIKQKEETSVAKIRKIKEVLFPGGELQERIENFIPFYLQQGPSFFDMLKENFDPMEFLFEILTEE
jgi:bacillithiol synthase